MINKNALHQRLVAILEDELKSLEEAFESSSAVLKQDDMKQEGKYDTRRIEAGYLVSAQRARLEKSKSDLSIVKSLDTSNKDKVLPGALVVVERNEENHYYFITQSIAGMKLELDKKLIHIISIDSPLGSEIMGLEAGDNTEIESPRGEETIEIISIE